MPHHIVYLSRAAQPFSDAELLSLLSQARHDNTTQDITGLLLYGSDQFVQVIEGEEAAVQALYARIRQDARHRDVVTFADKPIPARAFAGWSMAFRPLEAAQFQELLGYLPLAGLPAAQVGLSATDHQLMQTLRGFVLPENDQPPPSAG